MQNLRVVNTASRRAAVVITLCTGALTEFSIGSGTSPALGTDDGGNAFGSDGWFLGGGGS